MIGCTSRALPLTSITVTKPSTPKPMPAGVGADVGPALGKGESAFEECAHGAETYAAVLMRRASPRATTS